MEERLKATMEVLVVDDEPDLKIKIRNILESSGIKVCWALNWRETDVFLKERIDQGLSLPDVFLVDMYFEQEEHCFLGSNPAMEGLLIIGKIVKVIEAVGIKPPPIIGFTGKQRYMEAETIIEYGATDFITEAEYNRPNHFTRRLIKCVMETSTDRSIKPPRKEVIRQIEEQMVTKAMKNKQNDLKQAAFLLKWPVREVRRIAGRIEVIGGNNG